jgi:hypothetical protein
LGLYQSLRVCGLLLINKSLKIKDINESIPAKAYSHQQVSVWFHPLLPPYYEKDYGGGLTTYNPIKTKII